MIIVGILGIILRAVLQSSIQNKYFFITYKIRDHLFVYYPCRPQDYTYDVPNPEKFPQHLGTDGRVRVT